MNNAKKEKLLRELYAKLRAGIKPGLERTIALASAVGNPQNDYPTIHIAGTNGKGTTCSVVTSLLTEMGLKVGLYTSPHIKDFNERIRVNGTRIADDELVDFSETLLPKAEELDATFFEITTVMAFMHFHNHEVDVAVIETGMGGRFDSTNILSPTVTCITDIDLDHQEFLGDTIEQISFEKAGIIKQDTPVVTTNQDESILNVINKKAEEMSADIISPNEEIDKTVLKEIEKRYISQSFQKNYKAALTVTELYLGNPVDKDIQLKAVKNLRENSGYFGRMEVIDSSPLTIIDIAHSPAAVGNLIDSITMRYPNQKWTIILAMMKDKNYRDIINQLEHIAERFIFTQVKGERSAKAIELASAVINSEVEYSICENPNAALNEAKQTMNPILILGSFYLASEVL
ncbi:MAG: bifunctional folylpolyglutamate synthase/dihydrofolate synthase [Chlorobiota bacterium]